MVNDGRALVTEIMVKDWLESGDAMMVQMAKDSIGESIPKHYEAVKMLKFLVVFTLSCVRLELDELGSKFSARADLYTLGLKKMGYDRGWRTSAKWCRDIGTLDKVIDSASYVKVDW